MCKTLDTKKREGSKKEAEKSSQKDLISIGERKKEEQKKKKSLDERFICVKNYHTLCVHASMKLFIAK